ncbi:hypothetical protein [Helicobacter sp. 13S00477-4]|uniref:hypothetical protein n=1 Tax=Helicobacter sp. 13S00477-4 TaxID=1905759 RepID=UPI000BA5DD5D|nr:hypothetical protein [Helicobacter sp. 13S00477-4]PAF50481.1 hypothetical protein BKH44_08195 [Helicobacter sp. 13S00477-4]
MYHPFKSSFPLNIISMVLALNITTNTLSATGMLIDDPITQANTALTASRMAENIDKLTKQIEQYTQMIEKAKEQVDQLNKVNTMMNNVNSFLNSSTIAIANPMDIIDDFKDITSRMEHNAKKLAKTIEQYDIRDKIHSRRLNEAYPWLNYNQIAPQETNLPFTKVGKETQTIKSIKNLMNALSDDIVGNTESIMGTFSGRAMAIEFCKNANKLEQEVKDNKLFLTEKEALLNKDFEKYAQIRKERIKNKIAYKKKIQFLDNAGINPLLNRSKQMLETVGTKDKSYNKKSKDGKTEMIYCKETRTDKGEFCYPEFYDTKRLNDDFLQIQQELAKKLQSAGSDKQKQASAYADIKQKTDNLMLSYIKDIATNLSFLNETMALTGNLIAREIINTNMEIWIHQMNLIKK